jgi:hypothetical protein
MRKTSEISATDFETTASLNSLKEIEKLAPNKVPGVKTVLVVMSGHAVSYDVEALRNKILAAYPEATVFFRSTGGYPIGMASFSNIDLLIDLTGPRQRQPWFYARKLRKMCKFTVGRNAGMFRKYIYDRVFDEKDGRAIPHNMLDRERFVQRQVLALAGVPLVAAGDATADRSKTIALDLPPMSHP